MEGLSHYTVSTTIGISVAVIIAASQTLMGLPVFPVAIPLGSAPGGFKADLDIEGNPEARSSKVALFIVKHLPFLKSAFSHRGLTHTLLFPALVYGLAHSMVSPDLTWAVKFVVSVLIGWIIGYCSHIFIDIFNGKGVPVFWPIYPKKIHIMSVNAGTFEEYIFLFIWVVFIVSHTTLVYLGMTI